MVDKDPDAEYRPRRAWVDPADPSTPDAPSPTPEASSSTPDFPSPTPDAPSPTPDAAETTVLRRVPRRRPGRDERSAEEVGDATTVLPRTPAGSRVVPMDDDDFDDRPAPGLRLRMTLVIAAVAAVVVAGLAIGYAVISATEQQGVVPSPGPTASGSPSASAGDPSVAPAVLLDDAMMASTKEGLLIDDERTWKVAGTQRGITDDVQAACLGGDPADGQPTPQQIIFRLLSSDGKRPPGLLHRADAYATPEEAAQAYAVMSKAMGGCAIPGGYIDSGRVLGGIGDQSVGLVLKVADGSAVTYRSLAMSRTGRVLNVLDVAQPEKAVGYGGVTRALAAVTARQCRAAGGRCNGDVDADEGPPPLGGDQPGFLATGDLPPAGEDRTPWVGVTPAAPSDEFAGSGCETTNWATVKAAARTSRVYLQEEGATTLGLDQIVITTGSDAAARDLVEKVKDDLDSCPDRKLTAKVSGLDEVSGTGARGADIDGYVAVVTQDAEEPSTYRVGIVSVGRKVVFTFLNVQRSLDLTADEFSMVAVRAAQRASQVK